MMTLLLLVIFTTFIGVGLPDSMLGTAWPAMRAELGLPLSLAGYVSAAISGCTIVSSLLSARLIGRFGTGRVAAVSTLLTAAALLGFAFVGHPAFLFLLAIPLGLGGGCIDTALNNFVALHYDAARMNFLHCFYGLGVALSPYLMSLALGDSDDWRKGYLVVAAVQFAITAVAFAALPLWRKAEARDRLTEEGASLQIVPLRTLLRLRDVRLSCLTFLGACALELCAGSWCSSYFVNVRGLRADAAAQTAMLFYVGLAAGRFLSGLLTHFLGRRRILLLCSGVLLLAVLLFLLPLPLPLSMAALCLIGLGVGPVYPNLTHLTPDNFGRELTRSVMGMQQASSYVGTLVMPWLFGVLAQRWSASLLPPYLLVLFLLYALALAALLYNVQKKKKGVADA